MALGFDVLLAKDSFPFQIVLGWNNNELAKPTKPAHRLFFGTFLEDNKPR